MRVITDEIIKGFEKHLYEEKRSLNTIEKYMRDVRRFSEHMGGRNLEKTDILEYKKQLCDIYLPASVNSILSSLNALLRFLGWHDLRVKNLKIQRKIFADKEKELTKSEYEKLLLAAENRKNKRLYYLIQTFASTGLRVSEIKHITVEALKIGQATINCKGKIRQIFLPKKLCGMLKQYARENGIKSGAIFVSRNGKPLDRSYICKLLKSLCGAAGVSKEKVFPHNFRHLFARTYYGLQNDVVGLADVLGHSSVETTRIYTMSCGERQRRQIEKLGFLKL